LFKEEQEKNELWEGNDGTAEKPLGIDHILFNKLYDYCNEGIEKLEQERGNVDITEISPDLAKMEAHLHAYKADAAGLLFKETADLFWAKKWYKGYKRSAELCQIIDVDHAAHAFGFAAEAAKYIFQRIMYIGDVKNEQEAEENGKEYDQKDHAKKWIEKCFNDYFKCAQTLSITNPKLASVYYRNAAEIALEAVILLKNKEWITKATDSHLMAVNFAEQFEDKSILFFIYNHVGEYGKSIVELFGPSKRKKVDPAEKDNLLSAAFIGYKFYSKALALGPEINPELSFYNACVIGDMARFIAEHRDHISEVITWKAKARAGYKLAERIFNRFPDVLSEERHKKHLAYSLGFASTMAEGLFFLLQDAEVSEEAYKNGFRSTADKCYEDSIKSAIMLEDVDPKHASKTYLVMGKFCNKVLSLGYNQRFADMAIDAMENLIRLTLEKNLGNLGLQYELIAETYHELFDQNQDISNAKKAFESYAKSVREAIGNTRILSRLEDKMLKISKAVIRQAYSIKETCEWAEEFYSSLGYTPEHLIRSGMHDDGDEETGNRKTRTTNGKEETTKGEPNVNNVGVVVMNALGEKRDEFGEVFEPAVLIRLGHESRLQDKINRASQLEEMLQPHSSSILARKNVAHELIDLTNSTLHSLVDNYDVCMDFYRKSRRALKFLIKVSESSIAKLSVWEKALTANYNATRTCEATKDYEKISEQYYALVVDARKIFGLMGNINDSITEGVKAHFVDLGIFIYDSALKQLAGLEFTEQEKCVDANDLQKATELAFYAAEGASFVYNLTGQRDWAKKAISQFSYSRKHMRMPKTKKQQQMLSRINSEISYLSKR